MALKEFTVFLLSGRAYDFVEGELKRVDIKLQGSLSEIAQEVDRLFTLRSDENPKFYPALSASLQVECLQDTSKLIQWEEAAGKFFQWDDPLQRESNQQFKKEFVSILRQRSWKGCNSSTPIKTS